MPDAYQWEEPWIHWEYEDKLDNVTMGTFSAMYRCSQIRDGVRMYPYILVGDERKYLVAFEEP